MKVKKKECELATGVRCLGSLDLLLLFFLHSSLLLYAASGSLFVQSESSGLQECVSVSVQLTVSSDYPFSEVPGLAVWAWDEKVC